MKEKLTGTVINPDIVRGKSAYEIAVMNGFNGTEEEWVESLRGGIKEITLESSDAHQSWYRIHFMDGSTYDFAVKNGEKGEKGEKGESITITRTMNSTEDGGVNSVTFSDGTTLNVKNGNKGTDGKSAYQYAVEGGYAGSEEDFKKVTASADVIVKDIYGNGFSEEMLEAVKTAFVDSIDITVSNAIYDFKGATINNLNVNAIGATIKNAKVKNCNVLSGSRNCSFENVRFENETQCVHFAENTWAFNFINCKFICTSAEQKAVAMNAGANSTNTTLILTNCYFYRCGKIIDISGEYASFACSIIGGWADNTDQVVNLSAGVCQLYINGFDFEAVTNIFKSSGYTRANILVDGYGSATEAVVNFHSGTVNLIYNAPLINNVKMFSDNCPLTKYCNVPSADGSAYRFTDGAKKQNISVYVPPLATIRALEPCFVNIIEFDSSDINVFTNYGKYSSGRVLNAVTPVYVNNATDAGKTVSFTINTANKLI